MSHLTLETWMRWLQCGYADPQRKANRWKHVETIQHLLNHTVFPQLVSGKKRQETLEIPTFTGKKKTIENPWFPANLPINQCHSSAFSRLQPLQSAWFRLFTSSPKSSWMQTTWVFRGISCWLLVYIIHWHTLYIYIYTWDDYGYDCDDDDDDGDDDMHM